MTSLVLEEPRRAVATSPGIDLVAVARYTLAARRRRLARDLVLGVALVALIVGVLQWLTPVVWVAILGGWAALYAEACVARWGACAASLRSTVFTPSSAPQHNGARAQRQLDHIARYSDGNVTVYQGFRPFTGYGVTSRSWSLMLDTTKPAFPDTPIESFTAAELNGRLRQRINALDVPAVHVRNRLYISGEDVHHDRRLLPDPMGKPAARVDESDLGALLATPEDRARPYLTIEIISWKGEVVWSGFIRLVLSSTSLFVEVSYCVLPPLLRRYSNTDDLLLPPRPLPVLAVAGMSVLRLPIALLACVPAAAQQLLSGIREWLKAIRDRRAIRRAYTVNRGALICVREAATDMRSKDDQPLGYHRYFQLIDHERYTKVVDKRILHTVGDFLAEKNIDRDELNARGELIINSSVNIGGNATLLNSSIGGMRANTEVAFTGPQRRTTLIRTLRRMIRRLSAT
ncbi:hypothetical protein ACPESU_28000 [Nocardia iowensis]|uniref:Uncharacterized protein n=1 Tax=Nocardia iowensis TaxID=204891 RepID=A0ABX8RGF8_NOCIO|nr:hypothetical protein [Nocardia iowensis]QXN88683.1 hypothetical protein KV110_24170 [Nocardia iowensis]